MQIMQRGIMFFLLEEFCLQNMQRYMALRMMTLVILLKVK